MSSYSGEAGMAMAESAERGHPQASTVDLLRCAQCGSLSEPSASGWRACRTDDPEIDLEPTVAFFCPTCSAREFDVG
jgi:hypothetical protein